MKRTARHGLETFGFAGAGSPHGHAARRSPAGSAENRSADFRVVRTGSCIRSSPSSRTAGRACGLRKPPAPFSRPMARFGGAPGLPAASLEGPFSWRSRIIIGRCPQSFQGLMMFSDQNASKTFAAPPCSMIFPSLSVSIFTTEIRSFFPVGFMPSHSPR